MDIKIEVGQIWLTRSGIKIPITEIVESNGSFPIKSGNMFWMADGKYWSDNLEHSKDLITILK